MQVRGFLFLDPQHLSAYSEQQNKLAPAIQHKLEDKCLAILLLLLLFLLKALQLQGSFGLLNEFFPFGPVSNAVPPVCYFHICYVTFYIILPPIFRSS